MNREDVPLPERMARLDRDARGLPIPYVVLRDLDGRPHFTVNDTALVGKCLEEDRCAICGQRLTRGRWWLGGPLSALHEQGWYFDTPLHFECMEYAAKVCPYIAAPRYAGRLDTKTLDPARLAVAAAFVDNTSMPDRPEVFVAVMGTRTVMSADGRLNRPNRPHRRVEFWRRGRRLSDEEARPFVDAAMEAYRATLGEADVATEPVADDPVTRAPTSTRSVPERSDRAT